MTNSSSKERGGPGEGAAGESEPAAATDAETFDWVTLEEGEEVLWSGQPHFYSILPALAVGVPLSLFLIGIPIVAGAYLGRENTVYLLTSDGLYRKRGIVSRDVQKIEFGKVQNISFSQGPLGNSFGYGNVDISTAGGSGVEMQFRSVPDPRSVQERINREIRRSRGRDRPEDDEDDRDFDAVLDEILDELRAIRAAVEGGAGAAAGADPTGDVDDVVDHRASEGRDDSEASGGRDDSGANAGRDSAGSATADEEEGDERPDGR